MRLDEEQQLFATYREFYRRMDALRSGVSFTDGDAYTGGQLMGCVGGLMACNAAIAQTGRWSPFQDRRFEFEMPQTVSGASAPWCIAIKGGVATVKCFEEGLGGTYLSAHLTPHDFTLAEIQEGFADRRGTEEIYVDELGEDGVRVVSPATADDRRAVEFGREEFAEQMVQDRWCEINARPDSPEYAEALEDEIYARMMRLQGFRSDSTWQVSRLDERRGEVTAAVEYARGAALANAIALHGANELYRHITGQTMLPGDAWTTTVALPHLGYVGVPSGAEGSFEVPDSFILGRNGKATLIPLGDADVVGASPRYDVELPDVSGFDLLDVRRGRIENEVAKAMAADSAFSPVMMTGAKDLSAYLQANDEYAVSAVDAFEVETMNADEIKLFPLKENTVGLGSAGAVAAYYEAQRMRDAVEDKQEQVTF